MLVDHLGRPRFWASHWMARSAAAWADRTQEAYLGAIDRLYRSAETTLGVDDLDGVLASMDRERLRIVLERFFAGLRNDEVATSRARGEMWATAVRFVRACLDDISRTQPASDASPNDVGRLLDVAAWASRLKTGRPRRRRQTVRALPSGVVEDLYEIVWPTSKRNPFRGERNRHRNFVLFLVLLHQGLRRSEALLLPTNAVHGEYDRRTGADRFWLDVTWNPYEADDPRATAPRIKTAWSVRQIPLSAALAKAVENYSDNFRGRQRHSFLLTSQERSPLSPNAVNEAFRTLSRSLSKAAARELWNRSRETWVSPHDLPRKPTRSSRARTVAITSGVACLPAPTAYTSFVTAATSLPVNTARTSARFLSDMCWYRFSKTAKYSASGIPSGYAARSSAHVDFRCSGITASSVRYSRSGASGRVLLWVLRGLRGSAKEPDLDLAFRLSCNPGYRPERSVFSDFRSGRGLNERHELLPSLSLESRDLHEAPMRVGPSCVPRPNGQKKAEQFPPPRVPPLRIPPRNKQPPLAAPGMGNGDLDLLDLLICHFPKTPGGRGSTTIDLSRYSTAPGSKTVS